MLRDKAAGALGRPLGEYRVHTRASAQSHRLSSPVRQNYLLPFLLQRLDERSE